MVEFTRKPGDSDNIIEPVELPEGHAIIMAEHPDWVNLPDEICKTFQVPRRANILSVHKLPFQGKVCTHYRLDVKINGEQLWVAKSDQFYWYTKRSK